MGALLPSHKVCLANFGEGVSLDMFRNGQDECVGEV